MPDAPLASNETAGRARRRTWLWGCGLIVAVPLIAVLALAGFILREVLRERAIADTYFWQQRMGGHSDAIRTPQGIRRTTAAFDCTEMDDAELAEVVRRMPDLEDLHLCGTLITDQSFKTLGKLKQLKELDVAGSLVTPEAVAEFRRTHPNLKVRDRDGVGNDIKVQWAWEGLQRAADLGGAFHTSAMEHPMSLSGCRLSDDDVQVILTKSLLIGRLSLRDTNVTDDSLRHASGLCNSHTPLNVLNLAGTSVGDAGLVQLGPCLDGVTTLILRGTRVTDAGVAQLGGTHLIHLDLRDTAVTDAGLAHISGRNTFKLLRLVRLSGTQTSAGGIRKLRAAWPNVTVEK